MIFSLFGTTISGNKGAASMMESAVQTLSKKYPRSHFYVFSYYYQTDLKLNQHQNVTILNGNPVYLAGVLIPLSFAYLILRKLGLPTFYFGGISQEIDALIDSDFVLDLSGISFSDGRELYLLFNVAILLPGLLLGRRIVKCAQAMGPFRNQLNRICAKLVLPKIQLIIARGKKTYRFLTQDLKLTNVKPGADFAFCLTTAGHNARQTKRYLAHSAFKKKKVIGVGPSQVVYNYCEKHHIDYLQVMSQFINYLIDQNYGVALIPHSARKNSHKTKNNDMLLCQAVYERLEQKSKVVFVDDELGPRELKVLIGKCHLFIASRFHAAISSLSMKVPTLVIGWSHKYKEVFEMFDLERYALKYDSLSYRKLLNHFTKLLKNEAKIRHKIKQNLPKVINLSSKHLEYIEQLIDDYPGKFALGQYNNQTKNYYLGEFDACYLGYSTNARLRKKAASGGTVSSILLHLLETKQIQGAVVSKIVVSKGQLGAKTFIATTAQQIKACQGSTYFGTNYFQVYKDVKQFKGKLAIVALPCQVSHWKMLLATDKDLAKKITIIIGLFCGHLSQNALILNVLQRKGIDESSIKAFKFRDGPWRGHSTIKLTNGKIIAFPFSDFGLYQNLFFLSEKKCAGCTDHTSEQADISCGDVWDHRFKDESIKHSAIIARNKNSQKLLETMQKNNLLRLERVGSEKIFNAQNRSLIYHKHIKARSNIFKLFNNIKIFHEHNERARWNDYLAALIISVNHNLSKSKAGRKIIFSIPRPFLKLYLLTFKGLTSF